MGYNGREGWIFEGTGIRRMMGVEFIVGGFLGCIVGIICLLMLRVLCR